VFSPHTLVKSEYIFVGGAVAGYKVVQSVVEDQSATAKGNPSTSQTFGNLYYPIQAKNPTFSFLPQPVF
jgi:hypothetical protein